MPSPFDPAPSLPHWNYDWTSDPSALTRAMFDVRVVNRFIDAVNERDKGRAFYGVTASPLAHAVTADQIMGAWGSVRGKVADMGFPVYVQGYDSAFGATTLYQGTSFVMADVDLPDGYYHATTRRYYPREIASLTATAATRGDAAADGQIARFIGDSSTYGTNSGALFLRTSGAWAFDSSATKPDRITRDYFAESGLKTASVPLAGDYFCAEWINDTRDAINHLVVASAAQDQDGNSSSFNVAGWVQGGFKQGVGATFAAAASAYLADPGLDYPTYTETSGWRFDALSGGSGTNACTLEGMFAKAEARGLPMAGVCAYDVYFAAITTRISVGAAIHYNNYGSSPAAVENKFVGLDHDGAQDDVTAATTTGTTTFGWPGAPPAGPYPPDPPSTSYNDGFTGTRAGAVLQVFVRYDRGGGTDGFQYTHFTT